MSGGVFGCGAMIFITYIGLYGQRPHLENPDLIFLTVKLFSQAFLKQDQVRLVAPPTLLHNISYIP